jgi:hypothetical protein
MTNGKILPLLFAPLLVWRFYRRFRRNVGRQTVHTKRIVTLMTLMIVALGVLTFSTLHEPDALIGIWGGLAVGAAVGAIGFRLTKFESTPEGRFYTPNPYLGIAITMLLISRLAYRFSILYSEPGFEPGHRFTFNPSPLTLTMLGVTVGYYVVYSAGVLTRFSKDASGFTGVDTTKNLPAQRG